MANANEKTEESLTQLWQKAVSIEWQGEIHATMNQFERNAKKFIELAKSNSFDDTAINRFVAEINDTLIFAGVKA